MHLLGQAIDLCFVSIAKVSCHHVPKTILLLRFLRFFATINAIKGNSAQARMLILFYGLMIYDVMGLTLSRAVALVQVK